MYDKLVYFEKYSVAPSPSRDYYGIKVLKDKVILYVWKISHGPHLLPIVRVITFSNFNKDKQFEEEIQFIFGSNVTKYLKLIATEGTNLLTLPRIILEKLVGYLSLQDIVNLLFVSPISDEVINRNYIWEILYKRMKKSSKLSSMEREIAKNQGFKRLVKDHHIRNVVKKSMKSTDEKESHVQSFTGRNEKIVRSASVNIPKTSLPNMPRKVPKPIKSFKVPNETIEKKFDLPKKSVSEEKSSIFINMERNAALEGYRNFQAMKKSSVKNKNNPKDSLSKFKFTNEENEETELILPKELIKSTLQQADFNDERTPDAEKLSKSRSVMMKSPRTTFKKYSSHVLGESKMKSSAKTTKQKKSKAPKTSKLTNPTKFNLKTLTSEDKANDSDESGMSFLMKRYLEASDEIARKFSECERMARSTKNSSVQVDMNENLNRKPVKKLQKYVPASERVTVRRKA